MFDDERICLERGKIFRSGIVLALAAAAAFLLTRIAVCLVSGAALSPLLFLIEMAVMTAAAVILLIGELAFLRKVDERLTAAKFAFYSRATKYVLFAALLGFSLTLVFESQGSLFHLSRISVLLTLGLLGLLYISYRFKRSGICFNYTCVDRPRRQYCTAVLARAGILCLVVVGLFAFSAVLSLFLFRDVAALIVFPVAGALTAAGLAAAYLLLSFMEKLDEDRGPGDRLSFLLSATLTVLLVMAHSSLEIAYYALIKSVGASDAMPFIRVYQRIEPILSYTAQWLAGLAVCYLLTLCKESKTVIACFRWGLVVLCVRALSDELLSLWVGAGDSQVISVAKAATRAACALALIAVLVVSVCSLVRQTQLPKLAYGLPPLYVLGIALWIFLVAQSSPVAAIAVRLAFTLAAAVPIILLLFFPKRAEKPDSTKE